MSSSMARLASSVLFTENPSCLVFLPHFATLTGARPAPRGGGGCCGAWGRGLTPGLVRQLDDHRQGRGQCLPIRVQVRLVTVAYGLLVLGYGSIDGRVLRFTLAQQAISQPCLISDGD